MSGRTKKTRKETFTMRITPVTRAALEEAARREGRSRSEVAERWMDVGVRATSFEDRASALDGAAGASMWRPTTEMPEPGTRLVLLYPDASGGEILYLGKDGMLIGSDDCEKRPWFSKYWRLSFWAPLPKGMRLFCETHDPYLEFPEPAPPGMTLMYVDNAFLDDPTLLGWSRSLRNLGPR